MKILHILHHLVPEDGYAIRSKYIIENQSKENKVYVLTSPYELKNPKKIMINRIDFTYYSLNHSRILTIPLIGRNLSKYLFRRKINQIIKKEKVDVIHAHSPAYCPEQAYSVAKTKKIPVIYEVRGVWEDTRVSLDDLKENSKEYNNLKDSETKIMNKVDCIVTISNNLKKDLILRGIDPQKIYVVPNGVDTTKFHPREKNHYLAGKYMIDNCCVLGYIGSIRKLEGIEYLIKSISIVLKTNKNVKLLLVGNGENEYINHLISLVSELKIQNYIYFIGKVSHEEILDYYSLIDIIVIPRIKRRVTELVTPLKPLEAMSMEKLVISSDVGGLNEIIINNKTGILCDSENTNDLSEKIIYFIKNQQERIDISKAARRNMIKNHEWEKICNMYNLVYSELMKTQKLN